MNRSLFCLFGLVSSLCACSFITDFRDVEALGGSAQGAGGSGVGASGAGGVGGAGGGGTGGFEVVCEACQNCLAVNSANCPTSTVMPTVLAAPLSVPSTSAQSGVLVNDAFTIGGEPYFVGHFVDRTGANQFDIPGSTLSAQLSAGFVIDASGAVVSAASPCLNDGSGALGDETFFMSGAHVVNATKDEIVVAGAFEGERATFFNATQDCSAISGPHIAGPPNNGMNFVPFLTWIEVGGPSPLPRRSLTPIAASAGQNGYLSDVAAVPGTNSGEVVAIGLAQINPFGVGPAINDAYYLVRSSGPNPSALEPLDFKSCKVNHFETLDGLRSSVAVAPDGEVWFAGSGCPSIAPQNDAERAFMGHASSDLATPVTRTFGNDTNLVSITEIAVSTSHVIVAGTYTGQVVPTLMNDAPTDSGDEGDGFVMAFDRASWTDGSRPVWFRRIASDGGPAQITGLVVDNGRVFVSGHVGDDATIAPVQSCISSNALGRGRALFAMMSEANGGLDWMRIEGAEPPEPDPAGQQLFFATGTTIVPVNGAVYTATSSHGKMLLECGGNSTVDNKPKATLRRLDLPGG